ncbi:NUDIX hydrolase [Deinococcus taeanensis]|uniref:NUDIX hydrolase n=1 Tax=Deinococcus taeanensis TaxID=2737050 RepID=UPI001CDD8AC7|nr:NUDIX hydrolase [Deinococcus taeanensis]UBV43121.1 NUDIX hydrolase [Deinococcus taeanensis]
MTPRQCAAVVIEDADGHLLLVKQAYGKHFWGLPGGVVDPGETPPQAAVREAEEEVGVRVVLRGVIGLYLLQGGGWPDIQAYVFRAQITEGEPRIINPQEISQIAWKSRHALPEWVPNDVSAAFEDIQAHRHGVLRTVQRRIHMGDVAL